MAGKVVIIDRQRVDLDRLTLVAERMFDRLYLTPTGHFVVERLVVFPEPRYSLVSRETARAWIRGAELHVPAEEAIPEDAPEGKDMEVWHPVYHVSPGALPPHTYLRFRGDEILQSWPFKVTVKDCELFAFAYKEIRYELHVEYLFVYVNKQEGKRYFFRLLVGPWAKSTTWLERLSPRDALLTYERMTDKVKAYEEAFPKVVLVDL